MVNRLRRRPPAAGADRLARIAEQLQAVRPTARDWTAATGYALLNWLLDLACLAACAHAVGLTGVGMTALLTAYVAGMAASGLSLLPGGLGAVDAALVLGLVAAGSPATVALSAVVLYRMISLVGVVAAGWVVHAVPYPGSIRPFCRAVATAREREGSCSLRSTADTWCATVFSDRTKRPAIWALDRPSASA